VSTNETHDASVCGDCLMWIANGEPPLSDPATGADLNEEGEAAWVDAWVTRNAGTYWVCSSWPTADGEEWTDEDQYYGRDVESCFSWSSCDACGSTLGGDRHPAARWEVDA